MIPTTDTPDPESVSDILLQTARLGLKQRLERLRYSATIVYAAIADRLDHGWQVTAPRRRRYALDTILTLCAVHAGKSLLPTTVHCVERVIALFYALYDVLCLYVSRAHEVLALPCRRGIPVPTLKGMTDQVRNHHVRRRICQIGTPRLSRNLEPVCTQHREGTHGPCIPANVRTSPTGGGQHADSRGGKLPLSEPAIASPISQPMPYRPRIRLA